MLRSVYINGRYLPGGRPHLEVEDRGFLFADSLYEVWMVYDGKLVEQADHLARLDRSLAAVGMPPLAHGPLLAVIRETLRRNRVANGMVYLQVTRGVAPRDHAFPPKGTPPGLVVMAKPVDFAALAQRAATGVATHLVPEVRWSRRTIKTTALLPAVLAKQAARDAGAYEGWFVTPEGRITEGASTNAWMVDGTGTLVTHPADGDILHGVTRAGILRVAHSLRIPVREVAFTVDDLTRAAEAFMSSATAVIMPVTSVSGIGIKGSHTIGEGRPGAVTQALRHAYFTSLERGADPG